MKSYATNYADKFSLNLFWLYGTGMITIEEFIFAIDKIKYDLTKEEELIDSPSRNITQEVTAPSS